MNDTTKSLARRIIFGPSGIFLFLLFLLFAFYGFINWWGKREWTKYRKQLEAEGIRFDSAQFIPAPVPDQENFYKAPSMKMWFQRDPGKSSVPLPIQWPPEDKTWADLKSTQPFVLAANGTNYPARVLLDWLEKYPEFELIATASERPKARLETGFGNPFNCATPAYVNFRIIAQLLDARARGHLALGEPESAFRDLHVFVRLTDRIGDKPVTLVSAMIRVAMSGLYVSAVNEGLQNKVWTELQLKALEDQMARMEFLPRLDEAFRGELAEINHLAENVSVSEIIGPRNASQKAGGSPIVQLSETFTGLCYKAIPRGWVYLNQLNYTRLTCEVTLKNYDLKGRRIHIDKATEAWVLLDKEIASRSPFVILAAIAIPNTSKAMQSMYRTQTRIDQARVVCALQRYEHAHHRFPPALDQLVPEFITTLPTDLISGEVPRYRLNPDGTFLLYNNGLDGKDEGGGIQDLVWPVPN